VKKRFASSTPSSNDRPFVDKATFGPSYRNYLKPVSMENKQLPLDKYLLSKSSATFYQDPVLTPHSSSSFPLAFYNSPLMSSVLRSYPNFSGSLRKDHFSSGSSATPQNLNSGLSFSPNHLHAPFLQSDYQQQNLVNALAEYKRIEEGMQLKSSKSHSTRTSTRDPPRNPGTFQNFCR